ncbi:EAL domain-containing protein [Solidesulfovibrio sp.]|uniref:EAL and HDOD domain-containing protein n=1 Tax=Solidesulfovibrio sp. TaxID=2910990 RepID=UPI002608EED1|nr:EAL domain-containing protein [Solidesulfovibrio sp.]
MDSAEQCTVDCNYAVARHPIYHLEGGVFGYELLYRTVGGPNAAELPSDAEATLAVLANGIEAISRDIDPKKKIFINFSKEILERGYHTFLDPERFVIEVLEHVTCDAAFTELVRSIREAGFVLALDDYVGDPSFDPILPFVTYIKIDFLILRDDPGRLEAVVAACLDSGKTVLAEKVETESDVAFCRARGIPLAQGYYYSRPQVITARALPANQTTKLALLAEVSRPEIDERKVREILGADVSLAYKLLRHVNTARFYRGQAVESLDYAIRLLGRSALISWLSVNILASLGSTPRDRELAFASAVRGRFLALIDRARGGACRHGQNICLLGLLSLLDAMLGVPMDKALADVTIDAGIRQALLGLPSPAAPCLALCRGFDGSSDPRAAKALERFGLAPEVASKAHFEALAWAAEMFHG